VALLTSASAIRVRLSSDERSLAGMKDFYLEKAETANARDCTKCISVCCRDHTICTHSLPGFSGVVRVVDHVLITYASKKC
jgi:hypothetical protein